MAGKQPMKIVIINTQYVETDAVGFKEVVQKLTGKDSASAGTDDAKRAPKRGEKPVLTRDISFKEFDSLLRVREMPSIDELLG